MPGTPCAAVETGRAIHTTAPASAAASVLRFAGCDKEVLEIVAGPGSIFRPSKEFSGCSVSAVEGYEKGVEILRGFCEQVWRRDLNDSTWGEFHLFSVPTNGKTDFEQFNFDAGVEFPPHNMGKVQPPLTDLTPKVHVPQHLTGKVWDYAEVAQTVLANAHAHRRIYRGVFPSWDTTVRAVDTRALVVQGATSANYERCLDAASHRNLAERELGERLVFINAWNEWAERGHLEPDRVYGRGYLEATSRVKLGQSTADIAREGALDWLPARVAGRAYGAGRHRRRGEGPRGVSDTCRRPNLGGAAALSRGLSRGLIRLSRHIEEAGVR